MFTGLRKIFSGQGILKSTLKNQPLCQALTDGTRAVQERGTLCGGTELENLEARFSLVKAHRFGAVRRSLIKIQGLLLSRWVPGSIHWHQWMNWTGDWWGGETEAERPLGEHSVSRSGGPWSPVPCVYTHLWNRVLAFYHGFW